MSPGAGGPATGGAQQTPAEYEAYMQQVYSAYGGYENYANAYYAYLAQNPEAATQGMGNQPELQHGAQDPANAAAGVPAGHPAYGAENGGSAQLGYGAPGYGEFARTALQRMAAKDMDEFEGRSDDGMWQ